MKKLAKNSKMSVARKEEIKAAKRQARQDREFNREYANINRERYSYAN